MSEHKATIQWVRTGDEFLKGKFSRAHTWTFDGGVTIAASSSPFAVPLPYSVSENVDPEEAYVASVSSCHMLTYLWVAYRNGYSIDSYIDEAIGHLTKNEKGVSWVSLITLHPKIAYGGEKIPNAEEILRFHYLAHDNCFIANSIKTEVKVL
jgi:organic hydroperoxide reductase OsmC/OhrA